MSSYFDQWSGAATGYANQYNIDPSIFMGLIETESNWNPYADATTSSAYGFTQLLRGTAGDLGVNRFDPNQNLQGGAQYLSQMLQRFNGNYTMALAAYHDGAGNVGGSGGFAYAKKVLSKAKKYGPAIAQAGTGIARVASGDLSGISSIFGGMGGLFGGGQDSCGLNPICYLRQWFDESGFIYRIALASVALLFILGALYLMKGN